MMENIQALLIRAHPEPLDAFRLELEKQSVGVLTAGSCAEAALALWSSRPPHLVFTEIQFSDGNWADVLTLASKASLPANVIVVAPFADIGFYLEVIDRGAFDYIVPPLTEPELQHVVRIAADDSLNRRHKLAAMLPQGPLVAATLPADFLADAALAAEE